MKLYWRSHFSMYFIFCTIQLYVKHLLTYIFIFSIFLIHSKHSVTVSEIGIHLIKLWNSNFFLFSRKTHLRVIGTNSFMSLEKLLGLWVAHYDTENPRYELGKAHLTLREPAFCKHSITLFGHPPQPCAPHLLQNNVLVHPEKIHTSQC